MLFAGAFASPLDRRVFGTANDFLEGGCKSVIMVYARASTEIGNIGESVGPLIENKLKDYYNGDFAMQGVTYDAGLTPNFLPGGSSSKSIGIMQDLLEQVIEKCPGAKIATGGYSQGTALVTRSIPLLSASQQKRIGAVVLFGDTQYQQTSGGNIEGVPSDRVKIFCNKTDAVCKGTLFILPSHLDYFGSVTPAADFITQTLARE